MPAARGSMTCRRKYSVDRWLDKATGLALHQVRAAITGGNLQYELQIQISNVQPYDCNLSSTDLKADKVGNDSNHSILASGSTVSSLINLFQVCRWSP